MKKFITVFLVIVLVFSLAACSSSKEAVASSAGTGETASAAADSSTSAATSTSAEQKAAEITIGVLVYKQDEAFASAISSAINKWAETLGADAGVKVNINMQNAAGDQSKQNEQATVLLEKGVDALAVNLVDESAGEVMLKMAAEKNVPILFYNKEPLDPSIINNYGSIYVGCNAKESGVMQGEMILELWKNHPEYDKNGDGKIQYVMFKGDASNIDAKYRTEYSVSTCEDAGVGMDLITGEIYVMDWDPTQTQQAMSAALANYGDKIEFVISNNDGMAMGAIAALNEYGYNTGAKDGPFIPIVGVDADESALEAISAGKMSGTVKNDADGIGKAVVCLSMNRAEGKDWLANTDYVLADDGYSIRIPYALVTE